MEQLRVVGQSVIRKDAQDKVTGTAKYAADVVSTQLLHAWMVTSPFAHANILSVDTSEALKVPGVLAVVTGQTGHELTGEEVQDRPVLANDKVRYFGEAVAAVVAVDEFHAKQGADLVKVEYQPLPVVNSPAEALQKNAPLIHEQLGSYERISEAHPVPGTNIAHLQKIRKGNMQQGWSQSEVTVEARLSFPPSDHNAMETRCVIVEAKPDGQIEVRSSSQAPFLIRKLFKQYFDIDPGLVTSHVPLVGGAYGGKAAVQLELIAYLASKAAGGRPVKLINTREQDMVTSPVHIGLDARVKLGSTRDGIIKAAEYVYLFDGGAYNDKAADIVRAAAVDCTGPYRIDHVWCDSYSMYTNHSYATPFRGFGHPELTFVMERAVDLLAKKLAMDPLELRLKNAIAPGDTTPTQAPLNRSNVGNLPACIAKLKELIKWDGKQRIETDGKIRAVGVSCLWKTSNIDTNASAGAVLLFNPEGSVSLNVGVVEIGTGTRTTVAQLAAERLKMDIDQVHVKMEIDSSVTPEYWKTVASRASYMVGRAVLEAADDAIRQLKQIGATVLRASPEDLEIAQGYVFVKGEPRIRVAVKDIAMGYTYPNGNSIGGQVIGRGNYILRHITYLDPETGRGVPGPEWTVGAQAVEVEFDPEECTYTILQAATVLDAGKVINPKLAEGQVMGAMNMGLSFGSREAFLFDREGVVLNPQLRTYRVIRYGDNAEKYLVGFVETPFVDAPYGLRGIGEHGVIGMPAALANSLSVAAGTELFHLPLTPELIWRTRRGAVT